MLRAWNPDYQGIAHKASGVWRTRPRSAARQIARTGWPFKACSDTGELGEPEVDRSRKCGNYARRATRVEDLKVLRDVDHHE
jgi:hypothetical protein